MSFFTANTMNIVHTSMSGHRDRWVSLPGGGGSDDCPWSVAGKTRRVTGRPGGLRKNWSSAGKHRRGFSRR